MGYLLCGPTMWLWQSIAPAGISARTPAAATAERALSAASDEAARKPKSRREICIWDTLLDHRGVRADLPPPGKRLRVFRPPHKGEMDSYYARSSAGGWLSYQRVAWSYA